MTWLRVDDKTYFDPRVVEIGNSALGVFMRCATWCADHLTDGFVPAAMARQFAAPRARTDLKLITDAGLWTPTDGGFQIAGFLDQTSLVSCRSRAAVLDEREKAAARQRRHRDTSVTDMSRRDNTVSHDPPDPTRPDPSAVHDQTTTTTVYQPPSSSSPDLHGIPAQTLDAALLLIAEAITLRKNPDRPRHFRHGVLERLRTERADEFARWLANGATAFDIAASEAGGTCWAEQALKDLSNGPRMELVQ